MKVAIYARYSSDNQRDASIADQLRICRLHAEKQGWQASRSTSCMGRFRKIPRRSEWSRPT